ncbi:hypothetical protein L2725_20165 [Shewanella corallii]|uniref:Uncharacterized protein n=2 Tax=Shewanella TaxID=22 RepID=A0ABT0ND65_9GAMM|nr:MULTISPECIES: hypothetical protein [Shewanella]MCL1038062.1 hypothetical protein [Shewanella submarina]MCL2916060.1 hypothetical protein [Shewanella corallii]
MKTDIEKLQEKHPGLVHSVDRTVESHTQREQGERFINTLMIKGYDVPFKYHRTKKYKSLEGQVVNLTYYPASETVAGFDMEIMKVVRLRRS